MIFSPNRIKVNYGNSGLDIAAVEGNAVNCEKLKITLNKNTDGVVTPAITALEDVAPEWLNVEFELPEESLGDDLYYYYAAFTTNDIATIYKHSDKPRNDMKDVFVAKNTVKNLNMNIGLVTGKRIFALMRLENNVVSVHYDLEGRFIAKGDTVELEKFIYGTGNEFEFLGEIYAPLVAKYNNARPLASVPAGWCSWSRYYRQVDEAKISNCVEDMTKITGADLFQIDDGWQFDGTFPGDWFIDTDKFPGGLDEIIKQCNDAGMTFGLWLSPFLVQENSRYYDSVKHLVRTDVLAGNSTPTNPIRLFDLDNPEFYEKLYKTYHWLSHEMGVKYYKLDFLVFGYFSFKCAIRFKSDYKSALFRKVINTIREAVGEDAIMLSCGSPIIECAGIFDAQRESRDIICPKSAVTDPFYWQHWSNIKNASKTVLYRYFYNNVIFRNDPDGAVLRDYDIGDGFDCSYSEARYWSTIVAFSGGLVLSNDEFRNLSSPRKELFTKLLPALGISGRAVDMFEYPAPTKAIIEASNNVKYIASFNLSDKFENMEVKLADFGIEGEKLVFKCWEAEFIGKTDIMAEKLVNPHNALMYMVKDVPDEPTFLYSNVNVYLGENIFNSNFADCKLNITINKEYEAFVNDSTKIFAYYPKSYANAITNKEKIVIENNEFIITEYKI
jgi:hypothetical protein